MHMYKDIRSSAHPILAAMQKMTRQYFIPQGHTHTTHTNTLMYKLDIIVYVCMYACMYVYI